MFSFEQILHRAKALTIFRDLLDDQVMQAYLNMINMTDKSTADRIDAYARFTYLLFKSSESITDYVWQLISLSENTYINKRAMRQATSDMLNRTLENELGTLQIIAQTTSSDIKAVIDSDVFLPDWESGDQCDFTQMYGETIKNLHTVGYGIYANYRMFTYGEGELTPVRSPDTVSLSQLTGYERERQIVVENTIAFIEGKPAANTLLYGDAGTGKSSTVKAIVNQYYNRGLRMIEVRKPDLLKIPDLVERLASNPLKFIIFIDDLSFSKHNEDIGALKAILEGSVSARTSNVIIYTTSNRRHLINEKFEDRQGTDVHRNETIEEQTSLSDRFGLSILFAKPSKDKYLQIVSALLQHYDVKPLEDMEMLAERFAMERGGRSGRTARQFVESLKSNQ